MVGQHLVTKAALSNWLVSFFSVVGIMSSLSGGDLC